MVAAGGREVTLKGQDRQHCERIEIVWPHEHSRYLYPRTGFASKAGPGQRDPRIDELKVQIDQAAREAGTKPGELSVTVAIAGGTGRIDRLEMWRNDETVGRAGPIYRLIYDAIRGFLVTQHLAGDWEENPDLVPRADEK